LSTGCLVKNKYKNKKVDDSPEMEGGIFIRKQQYPAKVYAVKGY